jgi:hypothetical protein
MFNLEFIFLRIVQQLPLKVHTIIGDAGIKEGHWPVRQQLDFTKGHIHTSSSVVYMSSYMYECKTIVFT